MCQRKHCTPGNRVSVHVPGPPQESLERDGTRTSQPVKPSPNPDNAGPIVHRPMGLPEPGSIVAQLALRCSALDHCATLEAQGTYTLYDPDPGAFGTLITTHDSIALRHQQSSRSPSKGDAYVVEVPLNPWSP
jgi:hypothetical protein